jgi:hypothetical protein
MTIYLQNKTPMKVIVGKTLEEMWTSEKPHVAHLKVFSCQTYAYVPTQKDKNWIQSLRINVSS